MSLGSPTQKRLPIKKEPRIGKMFRDSPLGVTANVLLWSCLIGFDKLTSSEIPKAENFKRALTWFG